MDISEHNPYHCDIPAILPGIVYRCKNDEAWTMLYMSENVVELLGYTMEEVNHITYDQLIIKEHRKSVRDKISSALKQNSKFKITYPVSTKNGSILWLEEYGNGVFNDKNELQYLEGYIHDITEETRAKNELIKANNKFRLMTENSIDCIWQMDKKLRFTYLSPALYDIFGYKPEEWIGTPLFTHTSWIHFAKMARLALRTLKDYKNFEHVTFESFLFNKNKELIPVEIVGKPLLNNNGKLIGLQGSTRDIRNRIIEREKTAKARLNYETLYNSLPIGIATYSPKGKVIAINEIAAQNLGAEIDSLLGKSLWEFLDKEMADSVFERISKCAKALKRLSYKDTMELGGKTYTFLTDFSPIINDEDKAQSIQISSTNITELEQANAELNLLKHRLEIANQAVFNGIWDWNLKTDELIWDDLMYEIYGAEKGDVALNYQKWENAVLTDDLEYAKQKIDEAIQNKGILDIQFRINHPKKGIRYVRGFAKFVELNEPHLIGVNYDNTERVINLKKIEQSEQQFRKLFEENNDIITILSPEGKLLNINSAGLREFNLSLDDYGDFSFVDVSPKEEDQEHSLDIIKKIEKKQDVAPYYKRFIGRGNKIKDYEVSVSGIYNSEGKLVQIVSILRDISERIAYEKELVKQTKKAEESDRLKTAFLMNMSHEIRTPLNAIVGFSDILKSTELNDEQIECIEHVQQGSDRIINTVNDLLEASQIQQGQLKLNLEECGIKSMLAELYYVSKNLYQNQLNDVELIFNSNLTEDTTLLIDTERFKSILAKIIDNAFKFTKKGSVLIDCFETDTTINLIIKDTGTGIEKDKLNLIFDFFRQGEESLTRGYEGMGLGLPIAKGIIELMGGTIDVVSEANVGTNISISLPLQSSQNESFNFDMPSKKRINGDCNILLIEDDEHSSRYIEVILKDFETQLTIARDGRSCKSLLNSHSFNIVFVDLKLPDISGLELIPLIRTKLPDSFIIVQSAFANQQTIDQATNLGADEYLTKPVNKHKVLEIVKQCSDERQ